MTAADTTYPNLGFNPVPGVPGDVAAVAAALRTATASLKESGALLDRVRDAGGDVWQGQAGDAFRSHVDGSLTKKLGTAQTSLENALGIFDGWHGDLVGFKSTAAKLDAEAAAAKQAAETAAGKLASARADPDFQLIGRTFDTDQALQAAQKAVTAAQQGVDAADRAAATARGDLDAVLRQARELESQHEALARRLAQALDHAASDLAPHKPGMFSRMWNDFTSGLDQLGSWVKDHLDVIHSVLSTISAVAGLIALVTPPPIDAIALGVSLVAGAGALAVDLADPKFRKGIGELLHGHLDKESLGALMTGATDVLSIVPGAGGFLKIGTAGVKSGLAGLKGAEAGAELLEDGAKAAKSLPTMAEVAEGVTKKVPLGVKLMSKGPQKFLEPVFKKVPGFADMEYQHAFHVVMQGKKVVKQVTNDVKEATS